MTAPNNPLNITDEDIGKEGRFLFDLTPAVLIGLSRDKNGVACDAAFKRMYPSGSEEITLCGLAYRALTRLPRKLYIGVSSDATIDGSFNTTRAHPTR